MFVVTGGEVVAVGSEEGNCKASGLVRGGNVGTLGSASGDRPSGTVLGRDRNASGLVAGGGTEAGVGSTPCDCPSGTTLGRDRMASGLVAGGNIGAVDSASGDEGKELVPEGAKRCFGVVGDKLGLDEGDFRKTSNAKETARPEVITAKAAKTLVMPSNFLALTSTFLDLFSLLLVIGNFSNRSTCSGYI